MKKGKLLFSIVTVLVFLNSLSFSNGLNLNGIGARAVAMGGAFVGLADDFTAVFWNPAGIAQFDKKYFGFYGTDIIPSMSYMLEVPTIIGPVTLADAESVSKHNLAGLASYYHPVSENVVAGFAVYVPSGLGIEWKGEDLAAISGIIPNPNIDWMSKIFVITISPAIAFKVNEQFMIGATLNINRGSFKTAQYAGAAMHPLLPVPIDLGQQTLEMTGWGFGATFGVLVKPSEMFSLGATFRTPSKISFSGETFVSGIDQLAPLVGAIETTADVETDVTWPMWLAGGIAIKPVKSFTLTVDVQFTQWSKLDEIELTFTDTAWATLMGLTEGNKLALKWDDKVQIRFGAEYWLSEKFALRAGYYFDPGTAPNETRNILLPITDFNCFAVGIGYNIDGLMIDLGVEYLMGKEKDIDYLKTITDPEFESAMPGTYNLKILALELSIGYGW
jgi:long-chain fatty acid transport protein